MTISTGVYTWGEIVGLAFGAAIVAAVIVLTAFGVIS